MEINCIPEFVRLANKKLDGRKDLKWHKRDDHSFVAELWEVWRPHPQVVARVSQDRAASSGAFVAKVDINYDPDVWGPWIDELLKENEWAATSTTS